jgi:hypothetical protein
MSLSINHLTALGLWASTIEHSTTPIDLKFIDLFYFYSVQYVQHIQVVRNSTNRNREFFCKTCTVCKGFCRIYHAFIHQYYKAQFVQINKIHNMKIILIKQIVQYNEYSLQHLSMFVPYNNNKKYTTQMEIKIAPVNTSSCKLRKH